MSSWVFCISLTGAGDARLLPVLLLPSALAASARSCSAAPSSQPKCQLFQGMFYLFISFLFFFLFFFLIIIISERGNDLSCMGEESVVPALPPCLGLGGMKPPSLGETGRGRARTRAGHSGAGARRCSQGRNLLGKSLEMARAPSKSLVQSALGPQKSWKIGCLSRFPPGMDPAPSCSPSRVNCHFWGGKRLGFEDDPLLVPSECTYYWKGHGLRVVNYYF